MPRSCRPQASRALLFGLLAVPIFYGSFFHLISEENALPRPSAQPTPPTKVAFGRGASGPSLNNTTAKEVLYWQGGKSPSSSRIYSLHNEDGTLVYHRLYRAENICVLGPSWHLIVDNDLCPNTSECKNQRLCSLLGNDESCEITLGSASQYSNRTWFYKTAMLLNTHTREQHPEHFHTPNIWLYGVLSEADYYGLAKPSSLVYAYQMASYPQNALKFLWDVVREKFHLKQFLWFEDLFPEYLPFCFANVYIPRESVLQGKPMQVQEYRDQLAHRLCLLPLSFPARICAKQRTVVYVSRGEGNGLRRVSNWRELETHALKTYSLKIREVTLTSKLSYGEQAAIFNSADLLISTHGAQLFNIIYMRNSTSIIELVPKRYSECFLARASVYHLHYQICEGGLPDWSDCSNTFILAESRLKTGVLCNFTMPISMFELCLSRALRHLRWIPESASP